VQWLTAGRGIEHSEMFPLRERAAPNPVELFQIWLNLPAADKFAPPHFTMLWRDAVPVRVSRDAQGRETEVTVAAGAYAGVRPPAPPPNSWAAREASDLAIWTIRMAPHAQFTLPRATEGTNRSLYFFRGARLDVAGRRLDAHARVVLAPTTDVALEAGGDGAELLLLQGRPIGEPVVQYGPFVMNTRAEIEQAIHDYQRTQFGTWPWASNGPVHERDRARFARHADGRVEDAAD
jgi:redox-sensitive bicupin YhaK (pirin superfamily)